MRGRSLSYSPPPRRGGDRSPSPRNRYPSRREPLTSLLVRNIGKDWRADDLRGPFRKFGPLRDVYLPRDYYTREPRGFGFVQYVDPRDAEEAQYQMNHRVLYGREITVVFAEEDRKNPSEMRSRERVRGHGFSGYGGGRGRSPVYGSRSPSRSHSRSRSPRHHHHSRSRSDYYDRERDSVRNDHRSRHEHSKPPSKTSPSEQSPNQLPGVAQRSASPYNRKADLDSDERERSPLPPRRQRASRSPQSEVSNEAGVSAHSSDDDY